MPANRWARSVVSYLPEGAIAAVRRTAPLHALRARRPHRPDDLALVAFRRPNPVLVHAGVDIEASVASIRHLLGRCQVHAFEPNERLHHELGRHDMTVHGELLAADVGTVELSIPRYGTTWFDTDASLDHATAAMFLGERRFAGYQPARAHVDTVTVPTATLDAFTIAPDIVILDHARGADDALVGAGETIARHQPLIRVDGARGDALAAVAADLGYSPARYDPGANCLVLEQPGVTVTWLVHAHHRSLIGVPVV